MPRHSLFFHFFHGFFYFRAITVQADSHPWRNSVVLRFGGGGGCLGPCDLANVALVITPNGNQWLGGLAGDAVYEALINWARECHREGRRVALPAEFDERRFERFGPREEGEGE